MFLRFLQYQRYLKYLRRIEVPYPPRYCNTPSLEFPRIWAERVFSASLSVRGIYCQPFDVTGQIQQTLGMNGVHWAHPVTYLLSPTLFFFLFTSKPEFCQGDMLCLSTDGFTMTNCRVNFSPQLSLLFAPLRSLLASSSSSSSCPSQWNRSPSPFMHFVRMSSNWEG